MFGPLGRVFAERRPQGNFGQALSDPAWRRWFDQLHGATDGQELRLGAGPSFAPLAGLGASRPVTGAPGYSERTWEGTPLSGLKQAYRPRKLGEKNLTNEELARGVR